MTELDIWSLDRYAFLDPAGKKKHQQLSRIRANQAIVVIAADQVGRIFVLHAWRGRLRTEALIEQLFTLNERFKPKQFGIEANAMQELFADAVQYVAKLQQRRIPIVEVVQPTKVEKNFRIRTTLQPILANGRLFLQKDHHELRSEIAAFPTGQFKDLIDALASVVAMVPARSTQWQRDSEVQSLREYLLSRDIAPWDIERHIEVIMHGVAS